MPRRKPPYSDMQAQEDASLIKQYAYRLDGMALDQITSEINGVDDQIYDLESWSEALHAMRRKLQQ